MVGCAFSLCGVFGAFLTMLVSHDWLHGSQKIQFQICLSFAILLVLFLLITRTPFHPISCIVMGVMLHYSMLANFIWMLLAALMQYSRLVRVVGSRHSSLPLKSGLLGWGLPFVPVCALLFTDNYHAYARPPLCLPHGVMFHATILAPLCIIVFFNVCIFMMILKNLFGTIQIRRHEKQYALFRRFKQLLFLFVLLGLSWTFAVLQIMLDNTLMVVCSYLFCISIACQGFTYFVFFVLMDNKARLVWQQIFCLKLSRQATRKYAVSRVTISNYGTNVQVVGKPIHDLST